MESGEWISGFLWLVVAVISVIPIYIFARAYSRVPSRKLLYTTIAFCLFLVMGVTLAFKVIFPGSDDEVWYLNDEFWWSVAAILCTAIIGLFVAALSSKE